MGLLDSFKNPFGDALQRVYESQNELFKDVGKVIDTSHLRENPFLKQLYGENQSAIKDPDNIIINSRKDIVVVIDPGHNATPRKDRSGEELTNIPQDSGSIAILGYKHKIKGVDNNPEKDVNGKDKELTSKLDDLPDYVIQELALGTVFNSNCGVTSSSKWIIERLVDENNDNKVRLEEKNYETLWTFRIGDRVKKILQNIGYTVFTTREVLRSGKSINEIVNFSNEKNADYFISIHLDSSCYYEKSGGHTIYGNTGATIDKKRQEEFAKDITSYFDVTELNNSPRGDTRGLGVLASNHRTLRKVLFEIGYITNPNEFAIIKESVSRIATQIVLGLEANVARYYKKINYQIGNEIYESKEKALQKVQKKQNFAGNLLPESIKTVLVNLDSVEGDIYYYANP